VSEHLPPPDAAAIEAAEPRTDPGWGQEVLFLPPGTELLRIHPVAGAYPTAWDQFRTYGPTLSRFDHHVPPPHDQERGILYATYGPEAFTTAIAECFQDGTGAGVGPIDPVLNAPTMSVFAITDEIPLLDLDSAWITRARGNLAIKTGPRVISREWSRAIYEIHGGAVCGLAYQSSVLGPGRCVALWETAEFAIPPDPELSRTMNDPALRPALDHACEALETVTV
jgi:hypothetical protein